MGWWYVVDSDWPLLIEEVRPHTDVVTSVMLYCGAQVTNDGEITTEVIPECIDSTGRRFFVSRAELEIQRSFDCRN